MQHEIIYLLDNILGPHKRHANSEYYWLCPFCHHHNPKLAINLNKGAWHCWVCNSSGRRLLSLFRKLDCSKEQIAELSRILQEDIPLVHNDTVVTNLSLPKEYHPLYEPLARIDYRHALKYVLDRGLTASDILRYRIGYCFEGQYQNRIIVPSYDADNKLNYFVGRSFYEDGMKYKNPQVSKNTVIFENSINWEYPIVLCEGVYDAMAIKRNAIPLLGKQIPTRLMSRIIEYNVRDIYLALDTDAIKSTLDHAQTLLQNGRNVYIVSLTDKDPSEIGFLEMTQLIKDAKLLSFTDLVKLRILS
jgi:DNA primase